MLGQARFQRDDGHVLDGQHCVHSLIECLGDLNVTFDVDEPDEPSGEWWIDLSSDSFSTNVAWRGDRGFGIYTSNDDEYGSRPDEFYREPELAAKRIRQLATQDKKDHASMKLSDLRKLLDRQQTTIANLIKKNQGFVSRLERQNDALLSTVQEYVEALGGEMRLMVRFDGFEAQISLPNNLVHSKVRTCRQSSVDNAVAKKASKRKDATCS